MDKCLILDIFKILEIVLEQLFTLYLDIQNVTWIMFSSENSVLRVFRRPTIYFMKNTICAFKT